MAECLSIIGGTPLRGEVSVAGAKNSTLPLLISSLLASEECVFENVPNLEDVIVIARLLRSLGAEVESKGDQLRVRSTGLEKSETPYRLVKALRASFLVLGPLLVSRGEAHVSLPGGDVIGTRPVDIHLKGLSAMGAEIRLRHGVVSAFAPHGLRPVTLDLDYPSVGATEHLLMTAARIPGETVLKNAACEPEVIELAEFLSQLGGRIEGAGSPTIRIVGRESLGGTKWQIQGDRIEAATYLISAAATRGAVTVSGISGEVLTAVLQLLCEAGCEVSLGQESIFLSAPAELQSVSFSTEPYPGVPTDVQPLLTAMLATARGSSVITETVFNNRFTHVAEYRRFGAQIELRGREAHISGVRSLSGAPVEAADIRSGAGLLIMGLMADGQTTIHEIQHLDRGYENLVRKYRSLGADLKRITADAEFDFCVGC